ncbi:MAG: hypothetical protein KAJ81_11110 [Candidatus Latescibacteria bacterium]|nr:hypothetical protein [Candidatus Latescibacterota bacterium]MCK5382015.1 hypothetical protein [Candidatus Latescibacterota bacterium]
MENTFHYMTNAAGYRTGVVVPIEMWQNIQRFIPRSVQERSPVEILELAKQGAERKRRAGWTRERAIDAFLKVRDEIL